MNWLDLPSMKGYIKIEFKPPKFSQKALSLKFMSKIRVKELKPNYDTEIQKKYSNTFTDYKNKFK